MTTTERSEDGRARCGTCAFATRIAKHRSPDLCCWRYPPTIHRVWFRLSELYPSVEDWALCGEYKPSESGRLDA